MTNVDCCEPHDLFNRIWSQAALVLDLRPAAQFTTDRVFDSKAFRPGTPRSVIQDEFTFMPRQKQQVFLVESAEALQHLGEYLADRAAATARAAPTDPCRHWSAVIALLAQENPALRVSFVAGGFEAIRAAYPCICTSFGGSRVTYPQHITDYLYLGAHVSAKSRAVFTNLGIRAVVNCTRECSNAFEKDSTLGVSYLQLPLDDSDEERRLVEQARRAHAFIEEARAAGRKVLVHCQVGMCRSVAVVMAHLALARGWTVAQAAEFVRARRPIAAPRDLFVRQLTEALEAEREQASHRADAGR